MFWNTKTRVTPKWEYHDGRKKTVPQASCTLKFIGEFLFFWSSVIRSFLQIWLLFISALPFANLVKNCAPMQWCSSTPAAIKILLRHPNSCWKVIMVNISSLVLLSFTTTAMCIVYYFTHVYSYPFFTCYLTDFSSHRKNVLNVGFSPSSFSVCLPFFPLFSLSLLPFLVKICLHV